MRKMLFVALLYLASISLAVASNAALVIDQDLINGLFDAIGEIYKDTPVAHIWIKHPKVTINGNNSGFTATADAKNIFTSGTFDVSGRLSVVADLGNDKLKIKVYDVTISDFFGFKNFSVSDWYDPSFDIPLQLPKEAEVMGKTIVLEQVNPRVVMGDGKIVLHSDVNFR